MNVIKNRVEAINKLHTYMNIKVPQVIEDIKANGYSVKKDGTLFAKDYARLNDLVKDAPNNIMVYFKVSSNSVLLMAKTTYSTSEASVAYCEASRYINADTEFMAYPIHDLGEVLQGVSKLEGLREKLNAIQSDIWEIERVAYGR